MYTVNPSLTFVHFLCWFFLTYFYLGIIRTTGRSEGKNLSNIRFEIKYIILGVDPFTLSYIWNDKNYNKFVEIL